MMRPYPIAWVAVCDLWHERLLSLCIVGGLAAVIAPLALLFGLRSGVIEALRQDLVEDPVFRELRPKHTQPYDEPFFAWLRQRPDVAFAMESIAHGAAVLRVVSGTTSRPFDMLVSGPGDPLMTDYGSAPPQGRGVVLSSSAAATLAASPGDEVSLAPSRTRSGERETVRIEAVIAGVLPPRADPLARVYVSLPIARDIEAFRSGIAVPERGWSGDARTLRPVVDGLFLFLENELPPLVRAELTTTTGFYRLEPFDERVFERRIAAPVPDMPHRFMLRVIEKGAEESSIARVERLLARFPHLIMPFTARPATAVLEGRSGSTAPLELRISDPLGPLVAAQEWPLVVRTPQGPALGPDERADLLVETPYGPLSVPVRVDPLAAEPFLSVPLALAASLRRAVELPARVEQSSGRLVRDRRHDFGFRLYAQSIDDVAGLETALRERGIETHTRLPAILRIQTLDAGLRRLFWLIAALGGAGATLVLIANLYATVERKTADVAQLRLMGLSKPAVAMMPVCQAVLLVLGAVLVGLSTALAGALAINTLFATDLGFEGGICRLSPQTLATLLGLALLLAPLTALAAARRITLIEPADALRFE